ncbi:hypothetical protein AVEN_8252-1 [Araneus ventricosus]|uniref:Uncharacterized protein n=1 Tax=Araneus ventricosus TaxID=182803 RepID=A0A4Y2L344_ARAVE|nr:hypothetical protein AVEN_8252-1 [Araneus ventricosus]
MISRVLDVEGTRTLASILLPSSGQTSTLRTLEWVGTRSVLDRNRAKLKDREMDKEEQRIGLVDDCCLQNSLTSSLYLRNTSKHCNI